MYQLFLSGPGAADRPSPPRDLILTNDAAFYLWSGKNAAWALSMPSTQVALLFATGPQFIKVYDFIHVAEAWTASRIFARALGQIQRARETRDRSRAIELFRQTMATHRLKQLAEGMTIHLLDVAGDRPRTNAP